ncbi:Dephospho-CoA kinase [Paenibacillus plantiphilus]|uniref:Dephospho-CoA kinase n=1 Tax=Paenibacillus plantiphilus TaxID=2905650 RepID=A0ABN8GJ26_9BACL|nr:dephospho-CoA kinase [Paenibacillus plantiphilus]CAH1206419.1 Dephospho-CoA kinase [Paenibacillus plantiphilus]
MKLGLTGGIACGKSTVSAMLVQRGAKLIDADAVAREVVLPGEPALNDIVAAFGEQVLNEDGTLDRKKLGTVVFGNREQLDRLESILHPAIRSRMWDKINKYEAEDPSQLIVADIPLLYETGQAGLYDDVMVVYVPKAVQLERLMARSGMSAEEAEKRIALQMDIEEKKRLAGIVIDNSGTIQDTKRQIDGFWRKQGLS